MSDIYCPESEPIIGYLNWHLIADALYRSGVRQFRCTGCGLWHWPKAKFKELLNESA